MEEKDMSAMIDWFETRPINKANREKLAQCIRERLSFVGVDWASVGTHVKMLDYACGVGFLSKIFAPYVSSVTAIDVSPTMVERYRARMNEVNPDRKNVTAIVGNLLSDPPEPSSLTNDKYHDFDLITVGAALQHFPSTEEAVERLATRLRPGGVLYIQDVLEKQDHDMKNDLSAKRSRGYTLDGLRSVMDAAGLVDFGFEVFPEELEVELLSEEVLKMRCFAARAKKPKTSLTVCRI